MKALILSLEQGVAKLHDELAPLLREFGIPFSVAHSQQKGREVLAQETPDLLLTENWVPLTPPAQGNPRGDSMRTKGMTSLSIPGLTGVPVEEAFADVSGFIQEAVAGRPNLRAAVFYSARAGMPKEDKERFGQIAEVVGIFPYPMTQTNLSKFKKAILRLKPRS